MVCSDLPAPANRGSAVQCSLSSPQVTVMASGHSPIDRVNTPLRHNMTNMYTRRRREQGPTTRRRTVPESRWCSRPSLLFSSEEPPEPEPPPPLLPPSRIFRRRMRWILDTDQSELGNRSPDQSQLTWRPAGPCAASRSSARAPGRCGPTARPGNMSLYQELGTRKIRLKIIS